MDLRHLCDLDLRQPPGPALEPIACHAMEDLLRDIPSPRHTLLSGRSPAVLAPALAIHLLYRPCLKLLRTLSITS